MKNPKISLAQIKLSNSYKDNLQKIKYYIHLAKRQESDLVCFPESCIFKKFSIDIDHYAIKEIQEECKRNSIWCIITEDLKIKGRKYNCSLLIDRSGKIRGNYKKINLYGDNVIKGKEIKVFKTDFAKIGIAICWDLNFPELFSKMRKKGAQLVFCPSFWCYDNGIHDNNNEQKEKKLLESLIMARAFENLYYVAICSPAKESKDHIALSAIASPSTILKQLYKKEGIIISSLDLVKLKKIRKVIQDEK